MTTQEFEIIYLVNKIDESRNTCYALEEDILKILGY
jgi:hypothetical protein